MTLNLGISDLTETVYLGLGLEHVCEDSNPQNPWYLVSGPNEAQVLYASLQKEFSERQSVGKKWIYSDSERSTCHRQHVGHRRGQVQPRNVVWLVFIGWVKYANEWEGYSIYFGERVEIFRNWATTLWSFDSALELSWVSPIAQLVKNLPAMQETPVQFLDGDDPREKV